MLVITNNVKQLNITKKIAWSLGALFMLCLYLRPHYSLVFHKL